MGAVVGRWSWGEWPKCVLGLLLNPVIFFLPYQQGTGGLHWEAQFKDICDVDWWDFILAF